MKSRIQRCSSAQTDRFISPVPLLQLSLNKDHATLRKDTMMSTISQDAATLMCQCKKRGEKSKGVIGFVEMHKGGN